MFLDNWYKLLMVYNQKRTTSSAKVTLKEYNGTEIADIPVVAYLSSGQYDILQLFYTANVDSEIPSIAYLSNGTTVFYGSNSVTASGRGVILGDGNTPVSLSDYCLSGNLITDFSASTSVAVSYNNGKITAVATYNIVNTGASAFTIKEIGNRVRRTAGGYNYDILIARALLETPVTIAPGDTGVVTYKIEIS